MYMVFLLACKGVGVCPGKKCCNEENIGIMLYMFIRGQMLDGEPSNLFYRFVNGEGIASVQGSSPFE